MKYYTFKIKSNNTFIQKFDNWIGICRLVYNLGKEVKQESYKKGVTLSNYDIQKQLTDCKHEFKFISNVGIQTLQAILDRLDNAYVTFYKGGGFPKWASKKLWKTIPFKSVKNNNNNGSFSLPKWGNVKVFGYRPIKGEIRTANITKKADGFYINICVREATNINIHDNQVGIDMGITSFCTVSNGQIINNHKFLEVSQKKLRVIQRSIARKHKTSNSRSKEVFKYQRLHLKISRIRQDFQQKISTNLAIDNSMIISEDLDILRLATGSIYSKLIMDVGWAMFLHMLSYKTTLIKIDPKNTSRECFECGYTDKNNRLTQSKFQCVSCGHTTNADLNASKVILKRGQSLVHVKAIQ